MKFPFKESIFATIGNWPPEWKKINLAQGFPNFPYPDLLKNYALETLNTPSLHQYAPTRGMLSLREAIVGYVSSFYSVSICPHKGIIVTCGATQAIALALNILLEEGDEVLAFAPFYDSYHAQILFSKARLNTLELSWENDFSFTKAELEKALTPKTKILLLNTPHNPTGKVFTKKELDLIAQVTAKHPCVILSDEVYEFLTYNKNRPHVSVASHPDLKNKTLTISSLGKTFGATGWKIGWIYGPEALWPILEQISLKLQYDCFSVTSFIQEAAAKALGDLENYLPSFQSHYLSLRDFFIPQLQKLHKCTARAVNPDGSYFTLIPVPKSFKPKSFKNDQQFCEELAKKTGIASIPTSSFYLSNPKEFSFRLCFAKDKILLEKALAQLKLFLEKKSLP